ncbi:uncharacterized protein THITE_2124867 [Thermothielavioides terrestris NRRL 8126]|uniref:Iron-sulfur assembly protein 1 n=1 Tax=Thermothielavioides terrestris (strain ATCC 38088 / NRRL 8126) TaxID=578455 RepID=G2RH39_THETT|nr:uncharacterized protein THITE_2124867 [Thermothielavioides terrestris NRRL 8126]AEO71970.1 hypothetical protein THITE_2124867 [Thermothielavioides terrestris NRRL 8126]
MNSPSLLSRRSLSACFACRRNLLRQRQFSAAPASLVAAFHAYTLPTQPPPSARNASVPDTSIAYPVPSPSLPRIHETRSPRQPDAPVDAPATPSPSSIPEKEAQQSKPDFAAAPTASSQSPSQTTQPIPSPSASTPPPQQQPAQPRDDAQAVSAAETKPAARARPKLRARKAAMKLTPAAVERLRALLDQPEPKLIRVGVRNRGCSGLAYNLEYVDRPGAFDEAVEQDGVRVLIDSKALFSIIGSEMDWVEDKLSQRFVFRNPNIKEQCGCGESFLV